MRCEWRGYKNGNYIKDVRCENLGYLPIPYSHIDGKKWQIRCWEHFYLLVKIRIAIFKAKTKEIYGK